METAFKSIKYMFLFFICLSDFVCVWRPDIELTWNILLPKMILTSEMQKHQWKKVARAWKFRSGLESRFCKPAAFIWVRRLGYRACVWTWTGPCTVMRFCCLTISGWAAQCLAHEQHLPARTIPLAWSPFPASCSPQGLSGKRSGLCSGLGCPQPFLSCLSCGHHPFFQTLS